jgi:hypothetical protein
MPRIFTTLSNGNTIERFATSSNRTLASILNGDYTSHGIAYDGEAIVDYIHDGIQTVFDLPRGFNASIQRVRINGQDLDINTYSMSYGTGPNGIDQVILDTAPNLNDNLRLIYYIPNQADLDYYAYFIADGIQTTYTLPRVTGSPEILVISSLSERIEPQSVTVGPGQVTLPSAIAAGSGNRIIEFRYKEEAVAAPSGHTIDEVELSFGASSSTGAITPYASGDTIPLLMASGESLTYIHMQNNSTQPSTDYYVTKIEVSYDSGAWLDRTDPVYWNIAGGETYDVGNARWNTEEIQIPFSSDTMWLFNPEPLGAWVGIKDTDFTTMDVRITTIEKV